jgi:hypothetical protein
VDTNTPIFIFHGADDTVVGPSADRTSARELAGTGHDFVYTELDGVGHGFPASIQSDLFEFFDVRRLAEVRGRRALPPTAEARSSFLAKVTRDETRYLGDPTEFGGADGSRDETKSLLEELRLGGGRAVAAAERLGELADEASVKPLSDLIRHPATADDVKISAAHALSRIGHEDAYPGLLAGLRSEGAEVFAACARAMASCPSGKAGRALLDSLRHLDEMLASKRLGGNRIHISDWERWLAAFAAAAEAIGKVRPEGGPEAIRKCVVAPAIAAEWEVLHSPRVGQDPRRARRLLAVVVAETLGVYGDAEARKVLEELMAAGGDDADIADACRKALAR